MLDMQMFGTTEYVPPDELDCVLMCLLPTNRLVALTCLETGLRISDVVRLRPDDLSSGTEFEITEQKTKKNRIVRISEQLRNDLLKNSGKYYIFPNTRNPTKHRTRQALWHDVKRAAFALRLDYCIAPHSLRKCYAVRKYHKTKNLQMVQNELNHSNIGITALYALADGLHRRNSKK